MLLKSFRIRNFKSIINTGWRSLSPDNITVLIGQNEAGKSAILGGLYAFHSDSIDSDSLRTDGSKPEVSCSFEVAETEFKDLFAEYEIPRPLTEALQANGWRINLTKRWEKTDSLDESTVTELEEESILQAIRTANTVDGEHKSEVQKTTTGEITSPSSDGSPPEEVLPTLTEKVLIDTVWQTCPSFILFSDQTTNLPNQIDVAELELKKLASSARAAMNFLSIAGLKLDSIKESNRRFVENQIGKANNKITKEFQRFWKQTIGRDSKIRLECALEFHPETVTGKAGKPYLAFWISDGTEKLLPSQRSNGVRWFLSFFLQLMATQQAKSMNRVYLLDEPGGSLHIQAQKDMLQVLEHLKNSIQIIYTTHSPSLIDLRTAYRVLAVQRTDTEDDSSPTIVMGAHDLAAASADTLSPLYAAMGVDFSHQNLIRKTNNVLLEEQSAHYYLLAFWKLVGAKKEASFLPATGVNNVPMLANLLLGWALDFIVVLDDEKNARTTYNQLKSELCLDDAAETEKRLYKIKDCHGIEDIFSIPDFCKFVLNDEKLKITDKPSKYVKDNSLSKAVLAAALYRRTIDNKLSLRDFDAQTQTSIRNLVSEIERRLQ